MQGQTIQRISTTCQHFSHFGDLNFKTAHSTMFGLQRFKFSACRKVKIEASSKVNFFQVGAALIRFWQIFGIKALGNSSVQQGEISQENNFRFGRS